MMKRELFKTAPYAHQAEIVATLAGREAVALFCEMGTGKTCIALNDMAQQHRDHGCDGALVLAPNGVHRNWAINEVPRHLPDWVDCTVATYRSGMGKKEAERTKAAAFSKKPFRILIANHDSLCTVNGYKLILSFAESLQHGACYIDESDAFKNPRSMRSVRLYGLTPYFRRWRRIMTGTPITQSPFDAFGQFEFLNPSVFGRSFVAFKARYGVMLPPEHPLIHNIQKLRGGGRLPQIQARDANGRPRFKNLDEFAERLKPHCVFRTKEECLDLPPKIYQTVFVEMTPAQRAMYKTAKEDCLVVLGNDDVVASFTKLNAVQKLSQITGGYFYHEGRPVPIPGTNPKIEALVEMVNNHSGSLIVWAAFQAEIHGIIAALREAKISCVSYFGGTSQRERLEALKGFQDGDAKVLVSHPKAGGVGLTLTQASAAFYFSNTFSLRDRLQSEDRNHRIGQKRSVVYCDFVAEGTIDESILAILKDKKDVAEMVLIGAGRAVVNYQAGRTTC